ncbi:MAG: polysaccharide deacetylase family protein [Balneola sp.]
MTNKNFAKEKAYIIDVFCKDFLRTEYEIEFSDSVKGYEVKLGNVSLKFPDVFFDTYYENKNEKAPRVNVFDTGVSFSELSNLPAWFFITKNDDVFNKYTYPIDIFGMAFFLMTGYSDIHFSETDNHQRNIGKTSFLGINHLIDRPIIQEWFTVIAIKLFGEGIMEGHNVLPKFRLHISHDVDQPFEYLNYTIRRLLKRVGGDILVRHSFETAIKRIKLFIKVRNGDYASDPYNNFDELLETLKEQEITSTFFFVTGGDHPKHDVLYDINHPAIKAIVKKVADNGHEIGIHHSYNSLNRPRLLNLELEKLKAVCEELEISQKLSSSRKHYLRWDWKTTPKNLYLVGIEDDYTLGYADRSGFRAGVAFPFGAFDWEEKSKLELKIHPLILMECSALDECYMNLSIENAEKKIDSYHKQLQDLGGELVILWHNHRLLDTDELKLFKKSISL